MQYPGPHRWHPNPDFLYQPGAGPLFDMGPYYLTALAQAFGPDRARGGARRAPRRRPGSSAKGPRAGEEIPVAVPTYVAALYEFESRAVAQATFSFDSPLSAMGVLEITGTEATLVAPDPNKFAGEIRVNRGERRGSPSRPRASSAAAASGPWTWRARSAPGAPAPRRRPGSACTSSTRWWPPRPRSRPPTFVEVASRFEPVAALPEDWDPTELTLAG